LLFVFDESVSFHPKLTLFIFGKMLMGNAQHDQDEERELLFVISKKEK
jgi:hypothetical protein